MKTSLILFLIFLSTYGFAQTDTIRLQKIEHTLFRCTHPSARYWYLYEEENTYYLVNLTIQEEEIENWFNRYISSQNLFTSKILMRNQKEFFQFTKVNFPYEKLSFEILRRDNTEILTRSFETGEEFCFRNLGF